MALSAALMARFRTEIESEATKGGGDFIKFGYFTPPQDRTVRVRILPGLEPEDPEKEFYVKVFQHFNVSPTKKIPVVCPKSKSSTFDCPICQRVQALYKSNTDQDLKEAKYIKAKARYFMGVIPQEGEGTGQILIWSAPKQVKDAIIGLFADPDYGDITSLTIGRDVKITRTGKELNTTYTVLPVPNVSSMSDNPAEIAALTQAQPPLYLLRNPADNDNIRKYMSGETENLIQGFATAPKETAASHVGEEEDTSVFTSAPTLHAVPTLPAVAPVVPHVEVAPSPTPLPVAVAVPKKFDLSAIQAQVNKINKK
ncbi:MAG: hypothetical protein WCJ49_08215 [Deltaproteobacteria bacterium]